MNSSTTRKQETYNIIFRLITLFTLICSHTSLQAQVVVDTFNLPSGYANNLLTYRNTLKVDPLNNVWVGFRNIGAGKFNGTSWTVYNTTNGLPSNNVLAFAFSGNNTWIGTTNGLAKYNGPAFINYDSLNSGLTDYHFRSLFSDGNNLWIGTQSGIFLFDGINWVHYSTSNSVLPSDTVNCFAKSGNDTIWVGTNNGLVKFFNGSFTVINIPNTITASYNTVNHIAADAQGKIWIEAYPNSIMVEYNDSIRPISGFYSHCDAVSYSGELLGLNSYGNISIASCDNNVVFDLDLNTASALKVQIIPNSLFTNIYLTHIFKDFDSSGKTWLISQGLYNPYYLKLVSIDYHGALQPVSSANNCNELDINLVRAGIRNNGTLFNDFNGNAQYEVPKGSGLNSIFANGLWVGGLDSSSHLHLAAQMYRPVTMDFFWSGPLEDYRAGPLDTTNASIDSVTTQRYDSTWKIDRSLIDQFIYEYNLGNVSNGSYVVPSIILNWPAQGTGNISRNLAPFIDHNNDGIYNPYDGDYPDMKGDQMLWWVMNDSNSPHEGTNGTPMGIEVQGAAYAYYCPLLPDSESSINYSTFYQYKIINRSDTDYSQVYIGVNSDMDLGNYKDDYVGCDTILNIGFCYNGDNFDDGISGYGLNPPIQNFLFLSDTIRSFVYWDNDGVPFGNPYTGLSYYNYMKSIWINGNHVTYGGNGHGGGNGSTTNSANIMYSGTPYGGTGWTETAAGNVPGDRRFMASTGPINLPAHAEKTIEYAYVWTRDAAHPNGLTTSWAKNVHDVMQIKHWYETDSFPCRNTTIGIHEIENAPINFTVYPNPATQNLNVFVNNSNFVFMMELSDVTGRVIRSGLIFSNRNNNINVESIAPGIYLVKIGNKENFSVKKFIRQ
jgi:hypothetical protein